MTKRIEKMNIELAGNYADELKTLVSSLCEDIKDSESVTDAWNKIDRFYKDAESMRNKQKCTGSKSFSVLTDDVVSSEKIACYEFEHNDGDQIWTDCTEFYKNADGTYKKVFTDGWNGSKSECTVSLDDIRQMVNKCKSSEMYYRRGGYTILQDLKLSMSTFMGVQLSKEEEIFITNVIVEMTSGENISDEDILHNLIEKAESQNKIDVAKRDLRKLRKRYEDKADVDRLYLGKSQAYNKALDLLD